MAGIYLHIPFCRQACNYCNFHFTTSLRYKDDLVQALLAEMALQKDFLGGLPVSTIYFGGGTPSLLAAADCRLLLDNIFHTFSVAPGAEITLEANPDDITAEKLQGWKEAGVNRLSIGIQSFFEEELRWMNRAHNAAQAHRCLELSRAAGFYNLSIDLIYGSPLLTNALWEQNVTTALKYGIPHLSCYALTVEERTPLHRQIAGHQKAGVDSGRQADQFLLLMKWLKGSGYEHYEVSNFARPGFRSRHNSSYWQGKKYLGIGPSAHSFDGIRRQWNIPNNSRYIQSIAKGHVPCEAEVLTPVQQINEYIMISLRTAEGLDLGKVANTWGAGAVASMEKDLSRYAGTGLLAQTGSRVQLTEEGMLRADGIAADLFRPSA